jgi:RNA polymerase sigma factor (sigma-70 family)
MIKTKEEKEKMYIEEKEYISYIIFSFLEMNPTFYYMREDFEAECALEFLLIVDRYDPDRGMKWSTYLYQCINWCLIRLLAKEAKEDITQKAFISATPLEIFCSTSDTDNFEDILMDGECTMNQKEILRLKFIEGLTEEEIADELDITQQAVNRSVQRAFKRIRKSI